jgi:mono/diheme cytochrome c family protein
MNSKAKEIASVSATAMGLFIVVLGLISALQPEPPAITMVDASVKPTNTANMVTPPSSGEAQQGASLFARNCALCHGDDARGDEGPSLYDLTRSDARIARIIKEGVKGEMPRFESKFSEPDIRALIAYLRTLKS